MITDGGLTLDLDPFARDAIAEAAEEFEVSREEFARFAIMSYLAALDCGCLPRRRVPHGADSLLASRSA